MALSQIIYSPVVACNLNAPHLISMSFIITIDISLSKSTTPFSLQLHTDAKLYIIPNNIHSSRLLI